MTLRSRVHPLLAALGLALVLTAAVLILVLAGSPAHAASARAARAKPFSAHVTYDETNQGQQRGMAVVGIVGHGSFSGRFGAHTTFEVAVLSAASGFPLQKIAKGGTYVVRRGVSSKGIGTGIAVAKFKAKGLGKLCVSYRAKPGKFHPGMSFVPVSGTVKVLGGTGMAAHWHGSLSFKQNSITGLVTENVGVSGSVHPSVGKAKGMSAACKAVGHLR
jgi:hypothetical protein